MLADDSALCSSKAIILDKLNGLAAQVLDELKNLNVTDTSKYASSTEAYKVAATLAPFHARGSIALFFAWLFQSG